MTSFYCPPHGKLAKLGLFLHLRLRNIKFHSKLQRKGSTRKTCPFLPLSPKPGSQACMKTVPCLSPTQSPDIPDPMLCSSTVLTPMSCVTLLPTCSFSMCLLSSRSLLLRACSLGVPMGYNRPTPCSLFSFCKNSSFQNREGTPQPATICLGLSIPKFVAQLLPPVNRLKFCLCLLKLNKTFFRGDRMWGGNHLLHCPLTCYRRLQTPLSSPVLCAKHRLPALFPSRMPSEKNKQTLFKHLLTWSNKHVFCRGSESIRKLTKCQVFLFDLSLTKRKIRQFNPTDQHIIDKSPSSLECAFCIGKTNAFDCTVSQHHTKGKTLIKI